MKYIIRFSIRWASLLAVLIAPKLGAQTVHISHCMAGCPIESSNMAVVDNELVVRQLFVASISGDSGIADWQAYRVLAGSVGVASLLPREWHEDELVRGTASLIEPDVDTPQFVQSVSADAEERSYQLSEIRQVSEDEGRLVPMTSFAGTPYWGELNYLSNMAPLPYALRVGSWSRLDQAINALADRLGELYVISGPIYEQLGAGSDDGEGLPSSFFKIVSTPDAVSAFIFPSGVQQHIPFCDQLSTLQSVEAATGLSLFPQREDGFSASLDVQLSCSM